MPSRGCGPLTYRSTGPIGEFLLEGAIRWHGRVQDHMRVVWARMKLWHVEIRTERGRGGARGQGGWALLHQALESTAKRCLNLQANAFACPSALRPDLEPSPSAISRCMCAFPGVSVALVKWSHSCSISPQLTSPP